MLALLAAPKTPAIDTSSIPRRLAHLLQDPPPECTAKWLGYHYKPPPPSAATLAARHKLQAVKGVTRLVGGALADDSVLLGAGPMVSAASRGSLMPAAPPSAPPPTGPPPPNPQPTPSSSHQQLPQVPSAPQLQHSSSRQTAGQPTSLVEE